MQKPLPIGLKPVFSFHLDHVRNRVPQWFVILIVVCSSHFKSPKHKINNSKFWQKIEKKIFWGLGICQFIPNVKYCNFQNVSLFQIPRQVEQPVWSGSYGSSALYASGQGGAGRARLHCGWDGKSFHWASDLWPRWFVQRFKLLHSAYIRSFTWSWSYGRWEAVVALMERRETIDTWNIVRLKRRNKFPTYIEVHLLTDKNTDWKSCCLQVWHRIRFRMFVLQLYLLFASKTFVNICSLVLGLYLFSTIASTSFLIIARIPHTIIAP